MPANCWAKLPLWARRREGQKISWRSRKPAFETSSKNWSSALKARPISPRRGHGLGFRSGGPTCCSNIRGNLHSVIDLALFMGGEPTPRTAEARIILLAGRYKVNAALLISRMTGLRNVQQREQDTAADLPRWSAASYRDSEGRLWQELAAGELVRHDDFLHAGV